MDRAETLTSQRLGFFWDKLFTVCKTFTRTPTGSRWETTFPTPTSVNPSSTRLKTRSHVPVIPLSLIFRAMEVNSSPLRTFSSVRVITAFCTSFTLESAVMDGTLPAVPLVSTRMSPLVPTLIPQRSFVPPFSLLNSLSLS